MPEIRKRYDREFREGAVRIVEETGKPIAQVARDLGVNEGTLGNWWLGPGRPASAPRAAQGLDRGAMRNGAKSAVWSLSVTLQRLGNRWSAGMRPETRVSPKAGVAGWNPAGGTTLTTMPRPSMSNAAIKSSARCPADAGDAGDR
jgi:transposase-like protein